MSMLSNIHLSRWYTNPGVYYSHANLGRVPRVQRKMWIGLNKLMNPFNSVEPRFQLAFKSIRKRRTRWLSHLTHIYTCKYYLCAFSGDSYPCVFAVRRTMSMQPTAQNRKSFSPTLLLGATASQDRLQSALL
jgi:hypothetical protein